MLPMSQEKEAVNITEDWFFAAIQSLKKASPTSLKISLKSVRLQHTFD